MKKIIGFIVITLMSYNYCYSQENVKLDSLAYNYLKMATITLDKSRITCLYNLYEQMNENERVHFIIGDSVGYYFMRLVDKLFTREPSRDIYISYIKLRHILTNSAEYSQTLAETFSHYFAKYLPTSLDILEEIDDEKSMDRLVRDCLFDEESGYDIQKYLYENNLEEKMYFRYFQKYLY
jgi:hypothetical protein